MAKLEGHDWKTPKKWIVIQPLSSCDTNCDSSEYLIELFSGLDGSTRSCQFSVAGWQSEHDDIWRIAQAFVDISRVFEATSYQYCGPLHLVLSGNPILRTISLRIFLETEDHPNLFTLFFMQTSLEGAIDFGLQLEREICAASPSWASENNKSVAQ